MQRRLGRRDALLPGHQDVQQIFVRDEVVYILLEVRLDHYGLHCAGECVVLDGHIGRDW
jgi:hypothetical protein